jgi:hypothetical protein
VSAFLYPLKDPSYCQQRGRHGPFVNRELYAHFPGWETMAECSICGSTVDVSGPSRARQAEIPEPDASERRR